MWYISNSVLMIYFFHAFCYKILCYCLLLWECIDCPIALQIISISE